MVAASFAILLLPAPPVHALDPSRELSQYAIDVWTSDDGLPLNAVIALAQTRDGYLWVGTQGGLARFDGLAFTVFDSRNTDVLRHDHIITLLGDSGGNLWIGTLKGLYRYADGVFTAFSGADDPAHQVSALFEDSLGRIWVAVSGEPLRVVEEGTLRVFKDHEGKGLESVNAVVEKSNGDVCFHVAEIHCLRDGALHGIGAEYLVEALAIHEGRVVVGTHGGGLLIEEGPGASSFSAVPGMPHAMISSILVDRHGEMWVASFGGVARVREDAVQVLTAEDGLPHPSVIRVARRPRGESLARNQRRGPDPPAGQATRHAFGRGRAGFGAGPGGAAGPGWQPVARDLRWEPAALPRRPVEILRPRRGAPQARHQRAVGGGAGQPVGRHR